MGNDMDDLVQHEQHSHRDSIDVLDLFRGPLCLHGSLESEDNLRRNVAHAAPHRPYADYQSNSILIPSNKQCAWTF